ncbi:MAG: hypothetical protein IH962_03485 [Chloroflexi bacterium]|nr:hypothetical protein [Chloroflexota bacterium]
MSTTAKLSTGKTARTCVTNRTQAWVMAVPTSAAVSEYFTGDTSIGARHVGEPFEGMFFGRHSPEKAGRF